MHIINQIFMTPGILNDHSLFTNRIYFLNPCFSLNFDDHLVNIRKICTINLIPCAKMVKGGDVAQKVTTVLFVRENVTIFG